MARRVLLLSLTCILVGSCRSPREVHAATIVFTRLPLADPGGTSTFGTIEGRVSGHAPGSRIVLFAKSGAWYVQPFIDKRFTDIQPDSTWNNATHLGTEYAALLVTPDFLPPSKVELLPPVGGGVLAVSIAPGEARLVVPLFWQAAWFRITACLVCVLGLLALVRYRMGLLSHQLNLRFEERLAERTRIAHELHDTLLQGFLSASMQLHVAREQLPEDSQAKQALTKVQQLMTQVIEEGRHAVKGLRWGDDSSIDLEQAFARAHQDFLVDKNTAYRVVVEGRPRPLSPLIRDEVYRIGREALANAFRHSQGKHIEIEIEYKPKQIRLLITDDGSGIDPVVLQSGREGHFGLSGMRERAEAIGGRCIVRSRISSGTEVELTVPGHVAFQDESEKNSHGWFPGLRTLFRRDEVTMEPSSKEGE